MDQENLNLTVSCSPHVHAADGTRDIMLDVVIALIPAMLGAVYFFGLRSLCVMAVSVAACVVFEYLYRKLLKKDTTVGDCSAIVTGVLLAMVCPVTIPYWTIIIGDFFAIVVVKQLFGGIGCNFLNPALAGRAFLFSYPVIMTTWVAPYTSLNLIGFQRAGITRLRRLHSWGISTLIKRMHLPQTILHLLPQLRRKIHLYPPAGLPEIERPTGNVAAEHFFEAHGLSTELKLVGRIRPGGAMLIFHRIGLKASRFPGNCTAMV